MIALKPYLSRATSLKIKQLNRKRYFCNVQIPIFDHPGNLKQHPQKIFDFQIYSAESNA
jgi:hypothetical protein